MPYPNRVLIQSDRIICNSNFPVSLATSLVQLVLNLYLLARLIHLQLPSSHRTRDIVAAIKKPIVGKASSLIAFNLLTLVPNATQLNLLAQFIPFSLGGLLVLGTHPYTSRVDRL